MWSPAENRDDSFKSTEGDDDNHIEHGDDADISDICEWNWYWWRQMPQGTVPNSLSKFSKTKFASTSRPLVDNY